MQFSRTSITTGPRRTTKQLMRLVVFAALPGILVQWIYFGWGNLIQILFAVSTAWICEAVALSLRGQSVRLGLGDHSALVTALLLAISLPSSGPWWLPVVGTAFAILIAKHAYGGLGQNIFNPAMVGYVVLLISFPVQMTNWLQHTPNMSIDGVTQATPLDAFKTALRVMPMRAHDLYQDLFSQGWVGLNAGFLVGGIFLLSRGVISWHIPISFLISLISCASLGWLFSSGTSLPPWASLFSGATMLGAFFMATDPVTAAATRTGKVIFGALIGVLVWLIRNFGGYPDAVAFAILFANMLVPLIDHYTQPRVYGHHKG